MRVPFPRRITKKIYQTFLQRVILSESAFLLCQRLGFHVTPNHYYQPIPDTTKLKDNLWSEYSELVGVDLNEKEELKLLSLFVTEFRTEYERFPKNKTATPYEYYVHNSSFESVDGEILYCMIRHFKPRRIYEIGSGYSTYLSALAVRKNSEEDGSQCELVAIEPYPNETLRAGFPGLSRLIPKEVQSISLSEFEKLTANDILSIDSSHVLRIGNDVKYEYLDILPRLNKGVIVHVHDVFLPAEYHKEWVLRERKFWTEQYLLQAFLTFNSSFQVLWASSFMHLNHPGELEAAISSYNRSKTWPGSFWIRRTK